MLYLNLYIKHISAFSPQSTVSLADADATQHSLLIGWILTQVLAGDVPSQTEAYHNELSLWECAFNVAHHGWKLPGTTFNRVT